MAQPPFTVLKRQEGEQQVAYTNFDGGVWRRITDPQNISGWNDIPVISENDFNKAYRGTVGGDYSWNTAMNQYNYLQQKNVPPPPAPIAQPAPNAPQAPVSPVPTAPATQQPQTPQTSATGQKQYVKYAGSPDTFDRSGRYISAQEAAGIPNFFQQVEEIAAPRPDVKVESDFAKLAGQNISQIKDATQPAQPTQPIQPAQPPQPQPTQPTTGETMTAQKPYVQYEGSPDVFERATGKYISAEEAQKIPDFFSQVEKATSVRPGITTEDDFAKVAKTNLQLQQSGATTTPQDFQNNPLKAFQDTYSQIWNNLGLNSVKEQIETTLKAIKEVDFEMIDKIAEVNDNPWISEAERSRQVTKLQGKYEQKNKANTENLKLLQGLFETGQKEAQFVSSNALDVYYKERTFDENEKLKAMDIAEKMSVAMNKKSFQDLVGPDGRMHTYIVNEAGERLADLGVSELPKAGGDGGLTTAQMQTTINQIVGSFDNEQVVKNYNIVSEGYQFAKGLGTKKTPTSSDDQGLIYAFAKAMDPNSVVREGEYATVQKYAQSWAESFGFKAERIFSNTVFLTKEARQNMIDTIKSKFSVSEKNYQNVSKEYQRRIEDVKLGKVGGSITDYSKAFQDNVVEPTGDLSSLSNQEFLQSIPTFGPPAPAQTDNKSFFGNIYNWLTGK